MEFAKKHILIVGLGKTGLALAQFLKSKGARLTVSDTANSRQLGSVLRQVREMGIRTELGRHQTETFTEADLIVLSPGVPHTLLPIAKAKEKGVPVLGEIEFASRLIQEPIIAVTGTNGKTTTTALLGEMLKHSGFTVFVGGNIGTPLIGYVSKGEKAQWVVVEVSSFQLDTIETFRPRIGVILNITEDHLDRYADFRTYAGSKGRIFKNQKEEDTAVLNGSDPLVRRVGEGIQSKKLFFYARTEQAEEGAVIHKEKIVFHVHRMMETLTMDPSAAALSGSHNRENIAAAALATLAAGGGFNGIRSALNAFKGFPHRLEHVTTKNGVRYVNDSKATNVDAVQKALQAFDEPIILIMGGRDKGGNFYRLKDPMRHQVKLLILMGEAAPAIEAVLGKLVATETVSSMEEAVHRARHAASPGNIVLLSPGCTSFDMYCNYAKRGETFRSAVDNLK